MNDLIKYSLLRDSYLKKMLGYIFFEYDIVHDTLTVSGNHWQVFPQKTYTNTAKELKFFATKKDKTNFIELLQRSTYKNTGQLKIRKLILLDVNKNLFFGDCRTTRIDEQHIIGIIIPKGITNLE